jgi:hypothetical protein
MRADAIMAGEDAGETWYVRARGRVLGPLTWDQLRVLRQRGQLARFDQVSQDRQTWMEADRLEQLFPRGGAGGAFVAGMAPAHQAPRRAHESEPEPDGFLFLEDDDQGAPAVGGRPTGPAAEEPIAWYYAEAGAPQGPVDRSDLKRLARDGRIGPATLYWRDGLEQWTSGSDLRELDRLWPYDDGRRGEATTATSPTRDAAAEPDTSPRPEPLAVMSLVSNVFCGIGNLAAIIVGVLALRRISRSSGTSSGRKLALAGVILGVIGLVVSSMAYLFLFSSRPRGG